MTVLDIRQSDCWSSYLEMYGWKSVRLSGGSVLRHARAVFLEIARLQRPQILTSDDLKEIKDVCRQYKIVSLKISPTADQDPGVLLDSGYRQTKEIELPPRTSFIDLNCDIHTLWNNLTGGCRTSITKSIRADDRVDFIQNPNPAEIDACYQLIKETSKKRNFFTFGQQDLQRKINSFRNEAYIGNVYSKEGKLLGTKLFLGFNETVWGMHAGTTDLGQSSCGGYKLLWESFAYFKNKGYKTMDLEGLSDSRLKRLTSHWLGYPFYKLQFHGSIVEFPLPCTRLFPGR